MQQHAPAIASTGLPVMDGRALLDGQSTTAFEAWIGIALRGLAVGQYTDIHLDRLMGTPLLRAEWTRAWLGAAIAASRTISEQGELATVFLPLRPTSVRIRVDFGRAQGGVHPGDLHEAEPPSIYLSKGIGSSEYAMEVYKRPIRILGLDDEGFDCSYRCTRTTNDIAMGWWDYARSLVIEFPRLVPVFVTAPSPPPTEGEQ